MQLAGKHALVTGGGTGIGLAIATALVRQGAHVTITGRRLAVLEKAARDNAGLSALAMDVADPDSVHNGVQTAIAARGGIDICVPNAGIAEGRSIAKTDLAFWRQMMAINLDGAYLTIQACLPTMLEQGWGRVIAVSSVAGLKGLKGAPAYTASKHGLVGLIRALSADFLGKGITFNALCPAYVETDIIARNTTSIMERTGLEEDKARALMTDLNPHGRLIAPEEVAEMAAFLCLETSESINGQAIQIAGGDI